MTTFDPCSCAGKNLLSEAFCVSLICHEHLCGIFRIHSLMQRALSPSPHKYIIAINRLLYRNQEVVQSICESRTQPTVSAYLKSAKEKYMFHFCVIVFSLVVSENLWILQYEVGICCHSSLTTFLFTIVRNSQPKLLLLCEQILT